MDLTGRDADFARGELTGDLELVRRQQHGALFGRRGPDHGVEADALGVSKPGEVGAPRVTPDNKTIRNPVDVVADRYSTRLNTKTIADDEFDRRNVPKAYFESGQGLSTQQKSPSLSAMPSVVPPYTLQGLNKVESLSILPSLRQPYKLRPDYLTYNQYSPSIAILPPSIPRGCGCGNSARVVNICEGRPSQAALYTTVCPSGENRAELTVPDS